MSDMECDSFERRERMEQRGKDEKIAEKIAEQRAEIKRLQEERDMWRLAAKTGEQIRIKLQAQLATEKREVWDAVITGYLRYKQSLIPKPGCEKFPMPLLMSFEDWCRQQKEAL
ncbi:MAG: hypothetical protein ABL983_01695 [Nitrospira sp.]